MQRLVRTTAVLAALALAAVAAASAAHTATHAETQSISLALDGKHLHLPGTRWRPGAVRIEATSRHGEQELTLLKFRPGYGYKHFLADGRTANGRGAAAATAFARLMKRTEFLGGVDVFAGEHAAFTATVRPGTYYLGELNARPLFRRIHVSGAAAPPATPVAATIEEYDFGFRVLHRPLPASGTITIRNAGKLPHRLNFEPVRPGTTRAQVGAFLRRTGARPYGPPPPFARRGPELGTAVLGPGQSMQFSYMMPPGTYALISWQQENPDGKPQALRGMYAVTTLQ
jgi:hypothetical protein